MITLEEILALPNACLVHRVAAQFTGWAYDSRLARPGELFLALRTERGDGHRYIADALARGCSGVLCEHAPALGAQSATVVVVPDVLAAVQGWAARRLRAVAPRVLAVTGSVGKTSATRALALLLEGAVPTFRSRRSFNSLLGLPVALATLQPHQRAAVLEMGVDRPGEMARLTELFPPEVAVVTTVGATHLQRFGSIPNVAHEKGHLVAALPSHGCAVLNADDPFVLAMQRRTQASVLTYGVDAPDADLRAQSVETTRDDTRFTVCYQGQEARAQIALLGSHSVYLALAALGGALAYGITFSDAVARLGLLERVPGRLFPFAALHGATLLDDSYNASPPALAAALHTLHELPARRRVAVLGDMADLGAHSLALHHAAGAQATGLDLLVTCGDDAASIAAGAREAGLDEGRIVVTHTVADALEAARRNLGPDDLVLVKGSANARMERVVKGLLADAAAQQLLVRQEPAWATVRAADPGRATWVETDLDAIAANTRQLKLLAGEAELMAVLKADAYGHGALRVARTVLANGASQLAVATLGEAQLLRAGGVAAPLLVLGYTPPALVHDLVALDVDATLFDRDCARALDAAAGALGRQARVHVKIDTGMGRLGLLPPQAVAFMRELRTLPNLRVSGIYTHLSCADESNEEWSLLQLARFNDVLRALAQAGLPTPMPHALNSAGLLRFGQARYALVRPGIALYGLAPGPDTPLPPSFRPALCWKTRLARLAELPAETPVGYGRAYITPGARCIGTIPVGYADGFRRAPHWREVLVGGHRVPLVGRVCMDYAMLDITTVPTARVGDEVVLLGAQGNDAISAGEVAGWLGTSSYEVVSAIMPRVPRTGR